MNRRAYVSCIIFLSAVFIGLLSYKISDPWQYHHDDNGAWFSAVARAHLIKGLDETRAQDFFLRRKDGQLQPYLHHPPLLGLYLAAIFKAVGNDAPVVARTAVAGLHVIGFVFFILIVQRLIVDFPTRLWAVLVFAIAPMSVFYGKMPNHEPVSMVFLLVGYYAYLRYLETPRSRWLVLGGIGWALAMAAAWQALFVTICFAGHGFLFAGKEARKFAWMTLILAVTVPLLMVAHIVWAGWGRSSDDVTGAARHWLFAPYFSRYFTNLYKGLKYQFRYSGRLPLIFALIWLWTFSSRLIKRRPVAPNESFTAAMVAGSILFALIFNNALMAHAYELYYFLPFYAIASALFLKDAAEKLAHKSPALAKSFVGAALVLTVFFSFAYTAKTYREIDDSAVSVAESFRESYY